MKQNKYQLFIFSALECEAKPLIRHYGLKKDRHNHAYSIYLSEHIILTVTGVGKIAMAGAVAYTLATYQEYPFPVMVNIGIAGHKVEDIGNIYSVSKIIDAETGKKFYPQLIGSCWPDDYVIYTHSKANTEYKNDCLLDMEASAFYETAVKFSTGELIHCLKIISDNEQSSVEKIYPKQVEIWVADQINVIESVLQHLLELRVSFPATNLDQYLELEKKCHFSVSGKIKLRALLTRWQVLSSEPWEFEGIGKYKNSKEILQKLETDISRLEVLL